MHWLEVISLRSAHKNEAALEKRLRQLSRSIEKENGIKAVFLKRDLIKNDYCVQLIHLADDFESGGSSLGLHLASALKEFGLVHHSIWTEMKIK